jgi:dienelactone hydrolase
MKVVKNILLTDRHQRPIATDIHFDENRGKRPLVIYAHGFNGFKDWGNFDLIAQMFVESGFSLVKFNFAFNGTMPNTPEDFTDLDAFRENNYTKELDNLGAVIDWVCAADNPYSRYIDSNHVGLMGHSMGGGISIIKASEDSRIKALVTWASISECKTPWGTWPQERLAAWKEEGVTYIENSRTKQQMPLGYQLVEDYHRNAARLDIQKAIGSLQIPVLLIHGTADTSVPWAHGERLKSWQPQATLLRLETDHVFGRQHPWKEGELRPVTKEAVEQSIAFFTTHLCEI